MKKIFILSILMIGILLLPGCGGNKSDTQAQINALKTEINILREEDRERERAFNEALKKYAKVDDLNKISGSLPPESSELQLKLQSQAAQITLLQEQLKAQQAEITALKEGKSSPASPSSGSDEVMTVTVTKATDSISGLSDSREKSVDFTVKMVNLTSAKLDGIVIRGYIECNRDLYLADGYPKMKDVSNTSLLFDYDFDGDSIVEFEFYKSTGCPTVYLNPSETFIFRPQLILLGDEDYGSTYKFELEITDFEFEG